MPGPMPTPPPLVHAPMIRHDFEPVDPSSLDGSGNADGSDGAGAGGNNIGSGFGRDGNTSNADDSSGRDGGKGGKKKRSSDARGSGRFGEGGTGSGNSGLDGLSGSAGSSGEGLGNGLGRSGDSLSKSSQGVGSSDGDGGGSSGQDGMGHGLGLGGEEGRGLRVYKERDAPCLGCAATPGKICDCIPGRFGALERIRLAHARYMHAHMYSSTRMPHDLRCVGHAVMRTGSACTTHAHEIIALHAQWHTSMRTSGCHVYHHSHGRPYAGLSPNVRNLSGCACLKQVCPQERRAPMLALAHSSRD